MNKKLGEHLANLRIEKGLTQKQLADELRLSKESIKSYENNRRVPSDQVKVRIAKFFNVSIEDLFFREDL